MWGLYTQHYQNETSNLSTNCKNCVPYFFWKILFINMIFFSTQQGRGKILGFQQTFIISFLVIEKYWWSSIWKFSKRTSSVVPTTTFDLLPQQKRENPRAWLTIWNKRKLVIRKILTNNVNYASKLCKTELN